MGCTIVFVILLVIGMGILCFLTGDMAAFIALSATLVVGLGLAGILYHIYKSKQRRMEKYNPLSPTLRWMNAAGSILIAASQHTNFHLLAGWRYNNEFDRESIKTMLWDYWGIQGHETAIKEMRSLIDEGMRASYRRKMELLSHKYKDATEVQLIEEARKTNPNADEDSYLPKMLMAWRRYGENALLGWDMGRCAYITQCCYLAGYISMQEMLDLCVNAGMKNGINLLMILVLFISCVQEKEDNNVLRRVEACMELFPDSALSLLSQIECPECMRGQQRADYALLLTQALDKNYLDNLQSDSLIMIAVEYYKQEGDKLKVGKAYFYYGKVML